VVIIIIAATLLIFAIVCFFSHYTNKQNDVRFKTPKELQEAFLDEPETKDVKRVLEEITLAEIDLLFHVARVYCIGNNTPYNNWVIPTVPPEKLRALINYSSYEEWTSNVVGTWRRSEVGLTKALNILFPPAGMAYYSK
jgi:hypothetical protein